MTLNNLANLLSDKGENEEAEELYREALEIRKKLKEENEAYLPYYAMTLNNLAVLLSDKGENGEAEKLFREAFEVYSNALRKKVAFSDKKWLEYLGSWLYSRLILGVNGNREFFKRLCSLLAHERVIEPERDFFHFLVSELRSSPEREEIVADLKSSFEKVSSFLTPVCKKTLSDFIDRLEEALRPEEDKL
jgi:tetratricopeptide (TPR) repeat protein